MVTTTMAAVRMLDCYDTGSTADWTWRTANSPNTWHALCHLVEDCEDLAHVFCLLESGRPTSIQEIVRVHYERVNVCG
jgi:hypothetical protein